MKYLILILIVVLSCSKDDRVDEVPVDFTIRNESTIPIAALIYSARTHSIGDMPFTLSDEEFDLHRVDPGTTRENVPAIHYINGDGIYFQVYTQSEDVNGLTYSRTYNNVELIRQKKLLVYQSP